MTQKQANENPSLPLHRYEIAPSVVAFSTTREGGVSVGNYASFNINPYCGDAPEAVEANRELLCRELGVEEDRLVLPHQTHGTDLRHIAADFLSLPASVRQMVLEGVDGVMTDVKGVCIGVSTADCIPILIYDEAHHAVAAIHAGWRGTVERIAMKAVVAMGMHYQSKAEALRVVIGPGISQDAFEVGQEVYDAFREAAFPMDEIAKWQGKWHIDLPACNRLQLLQLGVKADSIIVDGTCTYGNADRFFSARRLGIDSGRIYTGIMLT